MESYKIQITWIASEAARNSLLCSVNSELDLNYNLNTNIFFFASNRLPYSNFELQESFSKSNIIIISHIILDEEVKVVLENLKYLKKNCTIVVVSSSSELMRLTRLGTFEMSAYVKDKNEEFDSPKVEPKIKTILKALTGNLDITPYLKDIMVLAPKLLKLLPIKKATDIRRYIECYLYMIEQSKDNICSMILMLTDIYSDNYKGLFKNKYSKPILYPQDGIYHPASEIIFTNQSDYLNFTKTKFDKYVGLILLRGSVISSDTIVIDSLIDGFESRGIGVIPAFSSSFDYRIAIEKYILFDDNIKVDALISLTGFPLVGGHVQSDIESSSKSLSIYNLPYFSPLSLLFQTINEWQNSDYGLSPVQTALHVSLPELDGAIEPIVLGGISDFKSSATISKRLDLFVERVIKRIDLKYKINFDKKIAITIFSFPPNKGTVGTAAYLDVFDSLINTLLKLKEEGYDVDLPLSKDQIINDLISGSDKLASVETAELNVADSMSVNQYVEFAGKQIIDRVSALWGNPPGNLNTNGIRINIFGKYYGKIFVGVQPSFGYEGDPMRLLFAKGASPHHGFLAYYLWIENVYKADAHIHFGTHGALEFMPGKQVGLSENCFPDIMINTLPNFYLYALNNPSEATIAKRRSLASIVSYNTPPLEFAGLYRELNSLKEIISNYREFEFDVKKSKQIFELIIIKSEDLNLTSDIGFIDIDADSTEIDLYVSKLYSTLAEIETRLIPAGLHTIGKSKTINEVIDLLMAISEYDRPEINIDSLVIQISNLFDIDYLFLQNNLQASNYNAVNKIAFVKNICREVLNELLLSDSNTALLKLKSFTNKKFSHKTFLNIFKYLKKVSVNATTDNELSSLISVMNSGYTPPAKGGDPVRSPDVLPSGRNIHALDPAGVPSAIAVRNARKVVEIMLNKNIELTGKYPESIGMILWGLDNIKTHGEAIAQAFILIGVEPKPNSFGRISRLKVIPLNELNRPRIDVTIEASGIFRDIFGIQIHLLDEAIKLVANLDEPLDENFVRKRSLEISDELSLDFDTASSRIFSNAPGAYGTNVEYTVGLSAWKTQENLADVFVKRKSFLYGKNINGELNDNLLKSLAKGIDTTFQNLDSSEVGITDVDHYFEYLGGLTNLVATQREGKKPISLVADTTTSNPKVRTLENTIRLEARTKILNPKWYSSMIKHGYQGVEEIRKRFDYTYGFSATAQAVESWVYDEVFNIYFRDIEMSNNMQNLNIHSYNLFSNRLLESYNRGYWKATQMQLDKLQKLNEEIEDKLEGIL